jgi:hypothetical protein
MREKFCERESILILYDLHLGAKINPATRCTGREDREKKREKERKICKLRAQIELYDFIQYIISTVLWM